MESFQFTSHPQADNPRLQVWAWTSGLDESKREEIRNFFLNVATSSFDEGFWSFSFSPHERIICRSWKGVDAKNRAAPVYNALMLSPKEFLEIDCDPFVIFHQLQKFGTDLAKGEIPLPDVEYQSNSLLDRIRSYKKQVAEGNQSILLRQLIECARSGENVYIKSRTVDWEILEFPIALLRQQTRAKLRLLINPSSVDEWNESTDQAVWAFGSSVIDLSNDDTEGETRTLNIDGELESRGEDEWAWLYEEAFKSLDNTAFITAHMLLQSVPEDDEDFLDLLLGASDQFFEYCKRVTALKMGLVMSGSVDDLGFTWDLFDNNHKFRDVDNRLQVQQVFENALAQCYTDAEPNELLDIVGDHKTLENYESKPEIGQRGGEEIINSALRRAFNQRGSEFLQPYFRGIMNGQVKVEVGIDLIHDELCLRSLVRYCIHRTAERKSDRAMHLLAKFSEMKKADPATKLVFDKVVVDNTRKYLSKLSNDHLEVIISFCDHEGLRSTREYRAKIEERVSERVQEIQSAKAQLERRLIALEMQRNDLSAALKKVKTLSDSQKHRIQNYDNELYTKGNEFKDLESRFGSIQEQLRQRTHEVQGLQLENQGVRARIREYESSNAQLLQEIERLNFKVQQITKSRNSFEANWRDLESKLEDLSREQKKRDSELNEQIEIHKRRAQKYEKSTVDFKSALDDLRAKFEDRSYMNEKFNQDYSELEAEAIELRRYNDLLRMELRKFESVKKFATGYEVETQNLKNENQELQTKLASLNESNENTRNYINTLEMENGQVKRDLENVTEQLTGTIKERTKADEQLKEKMDALEKLRNDSDVLQSEHRSTMLIALIVAIIINLASVLVIKSLYASNTNSIQEVSAKQEFALSIEPRDDFPKKVKPGNSLTFECLIKYSRDTEEPQQVEVSVIDSKQLFKLESRGAFGITEKVGKETIGIKLDLRDMKSTDNFPKVVSCRLKVSAGSFTTTRSFQVQVVSDKAAIQQRKTLGGKNEVIVLEENEGVFKAPGNEFEVDLKGLEKDLVCFEGFGREQFMFPFKLSFSSQADVKLSLKHVKFPKAVTISKSSGDSNQLGNYELIVYLNKLSGQKETTITIEGEVNDGSQPPQCYKFSKSCRLKIGHIKIETGQTLKFTENGPKTRTAKISSDHLFEGQLSLESDFFKIKKPTDIANIRVGKDEPLILEVEAYSKRKPTKDLIESIRILRGSLCYKDSIKLRYENDKTPRSKKIEIVKIIPSNINVGLVPIGGRDISYPIQVQLRSEGKITPQDLKTIVKPLIQNAFKNPSTSLEQSIVDLKLGQFQILKKKNIVDIRLQVICRKAGLFDVQIVRKLLRVSGHVFQGDSYSANTVSIKLDYQIENKTSSRTMRFLWQNLSQSGSLVSPKQSVLVLQSEVAWWLLLCLSNPMYEGSEKGLSRKTREVWDCHFEPPRKKETYSAKCENYLTVYDKYVKPWVGSDENRGLITPSPEGRDTYLPITGLNMIEALNLSKRLSEIIQKNGATNSRFVRNRSKIEVRLPEYSEWLAIVKLNEDRPKANPRKQIRLCPFEDSGRVPFPLQLEDNVAEWIEYGTSSSEAIGLLAGTSWLGRVKKPGKFNRLENLDKRIQQVDPKRGWIHKVGFRFVLSRAKK